MAGINVGGQYIYLSKTNPTIELPINVKIRFRHNHSNGKYDSNAKIHKIIIITSQGKTFELFRNHSMYYTSSETSSVVSMYKTEYIKTIRFEWCRIVGRQDRSHCHGFLDVDYGDGYVNIFSANKQVYSFATNRWDNYPENGTPSIWYAIWEINTGTSDSNMSSIKYNKPETVKYDKFLKIEGYGKTYYGKLSTNKPSYRTLNVKNSEKNYYLIHAVDESKKRYGNYEYSNGGSGGGWSGWFDSSNTYKLGNHFKIFLSCTSFNGNFDFMGARVEIYNPKTGAIIAKQKEWGNGKNWTGTYTTEWNLNTNEINALGGYDSDIKSRVKLMINRGSKGCGNRTYYDIHTYS